MSSSVYQRQLGKLSEATTIVKQLMKENKKSRMFLNLIKKESVIAESDSSHRSLPQHKISRRKIQKIIE